jgi:tetratricopeptide (TPR) repeat protein
MKRILVPITLVLFSTQFTAAQGDGAMIAKNAEKALTSYINDPVNNSAKLPEAIILIEESLKTPESQNIMAAWLTKGNIYKTRLQSDMMKRQLNPNFPLAGDNDALVAFEAYKKVYGLSQVKFEKSDAIKGISEVQGYLINIGVSKYEGKEYEKALLSFLASIESHDILKEHGLKSLLDDKQQLEDQVYVAGLAASLANRCPDAIILYNKLYNAGTDKPAVFEGLYNCKHQLGDEAGAEKILTEGRKKFPNDPDLLFAEINYLLKAGKLNELIIRLEQAIEKEPGNVGLYVTLGSVYDKLFQSALVNNDEAKANDYFDNAKKYFSNGLLKDPKNLDATYSLGALYYNKAAVRTQQLNSMAEDFSKAGIEKTRVAQSGIMDLFDQSIPYFKKAESIDPNDINTLIALTEIYAKKEDLIISAEMKKRLELVKSGGKNLSSYFQ